MDTNDLQTAEFDSETDGSYEMDFADNNDSDKNGKRDGSDKNGSGNGRGYFGIIILVIAFIIIFVLLLYFFVFRDTATSVTLSDTSFHYTLTDRVEDTNGDGVRTLDDDWTTAADGSENSFTVNHGGEDDTGIIDPNSLEALSVGITLDDEKYYLSIIDVLTNPEAYSSTSNRVIMYVTQSVYADAYEISGYFYIGSSSSNSYTTYAYSGVVTPETYQNYIIPIIKNVKVLYSSGITNQYYISNSTYLYSIESTSSVASWLVPLIIVIVMVVLVWWFVRSMSRGANGGGANPMSGFVDNVARKESSSKTRFADVAGCDEAKAELVEMVDYFHSADKYTRLGAKLPHGVLLVGPPGTGKTLLAKAVAGEANVPFYSISGSDFVEMYVGVGASRVRSLFKTAKKNSPCLIFIDEIDAVGRQRGAGLGGGNDEREQTLNELLVEMDGFSDNSGIIVMAATNRQDILDPALTRPGRFDRTITVDLPDRKGRAEILKVHSRNKKLASDVSFDDIAGRTVGFSGADLANIMNEAAILAVRANRSVITTADIDEAIDRAISGPAKKSHLEEHEKRQIAYHESGHAVIGIFLPYSDVVQKITIVPRGRTGGHVLMTPAQDHFLLTKNQMLARITGYLGGRTSEEIFFGDISTGASNDIEMATKLARSMVTQYGMSELGPVMYENPDSNVFLGRDYTSTQAAYSTQIAYEIDKAVRQIIDECHEKAREILTEHKDDVELIAQTLIETETITADQIDYLLKNRHLPPVDEHFMQTSNDLKPKNPNNIILYPGYEPFYVTVDKILEGNPSRIVLSVATGSGKPINKSDFAKACVAGAKDPKRVGLFFIDYSQTQRISLSLETFANHIESYAGVSVLLINTDDHSVANLKSIYQPKKASRPANSSDRPGVVQEILPGDRQRDEDETPTIDISNEYGDNGETDGEPPYSPDEGGEDASAESNGDNAAPENMEGDVSSENQEDSNSKDNTCDGDSNQQ